MLCLLCCFAAVKFRGTAAQTNFSMTNYPAELELQHKVSRQHVTHPCQGWEVTSHLKMATMDVKGKVPLAH